MSTPQGPGSAPAAPALTSLPRVEDIPQAPGGGYDADRVREAFDAFRRHATQLQAQLRVLQAASRTVGVDPTGHAVRMDALHLIRAAAEFADTVERDAHQASANQLARTEEEVRRRQRELQERDAEIERYRQESERQRAEILNSARTEAREQLQNAQREATQELREAEARAARLLEQARHQATELTNAARAEVEQTLEWSRAQATSIASRAQQAAEQLLASAGLGKEQIGRVADAVVRAAEQSSESGRTAGVLPRRPTGAAPSSESQAASTGSEPPVSPPAPSTTPPVSPPTSEPDEREDPQQ